MISSDPNLDMKDYLYTNSRNDSTEFVLHGTDKTAADELEKHVREQDTDNVVDEPTYELVFKAGLYTTWLNTNGDKVRDIGEGSFPTEYHTTKANLFRQFNLQGGREIQGALGMKAGPTAQLIASLVEEPTEIYFIGFDLYSLDDKVNNVYKGKSGYMADTGMEAPAEDFIIQHRDVFSLFPNIKHFKVNKHPLGTDAINQEVPEWKDASNLEYLTYAEMFGRLADGAR